MHSLWSWSELKHSTFLRYTVLTETKRNTQTQNLNWPVAEWVNNAQFAVFCTGFSKFVFCFVGTLCSVSTDVLDCWNVTLKRYQHVSQLVDQFVNFFPLFYKYLGMSQHPLLQFLWLDRELCSSFSKCIGQSFNYITS